MMIRQRKSKQEKSEISEEEVPKAREKYLVGSCYSYLKCVIVSIAVSYALVPLILLAFPCIVAQVVFQNLACWPVLYEKLDQPMTAWNLHGVSNFYIKSGNEMLGVWHILPQDKAHLYSTDKAISSYEIEERLREADSLILYLHGSTRNRGRAERLNVYNAMRQHFHVIALDYRGYGDSTGWPTENGLVEDSVEIFKWLAKRVKSNAKIIFWGASLGASISTLALHKISSEQKADSLSQSDYDKINSLVLEGASTNLRESAQATYDRLFKTIVPQNLFNYIVDSTLTRNNLSLETDKKLPELELPVLLLHAEDDEISPVGNSKSLYDTYVSSSQHDKKRCKLVIFKSSHKYGHACIHRAPELIQLMKQFMDDDKTAKKFEVVKM